MARLILSYTAERAESLQLHTSSSSLLRERNERTKLLARESKLGVTWTRLGNGPPLHFKNARQAKIQSTPPSLHTELSFFSSKTLAILFSCKKKSSFTFKSCTLFTPKKKDCSALIYEYSFFDARLHLSETVPPLCFGHLSTVFRFGF